MSGRSQATVSPPQVSYTPLRANLLQRKCACGGTPGPSGECAECRRKRLQRKATNLAGPTAVPPIVHEVLRTPGEPLDPATRGLMERRFAYDFGRVRVYIDAKAAKSAEALDARAFTVGRDVVFGASQYAPGQSEGSKLLAHELTHVVQRDAASESWRTDLVLGGTRDSSEFEAERMAADDSPGMTAPTITAAPGGRVQRQMVTPWAAGGGYGGQMERDRREAYETGAPTSPSGGSATPGSSVQVCSRDLQGILEHVGKHAYIEAPPYRYAVITPLCPASRLDNPVTGTTAQKWDSSPDPCLKTPTCVDCLPAPGVTDVARCMRTAFMAYNSLSLYRGLGPNSNTFAGTLARTCCFNMHPKPPALGVVPGWHDPPAPARAGATPCPPGPVC